jgi:hypothetical protein
VKGASLSSCCLSGHRTSGSSTGGLRTGQKTIVGIFTQEFQELKQVTSFSIFSLVSGLKKTKTLEIAIDILERQ